MATQSVQKRDALMTLRTTLDKTLEACQPILTDDVSKRLHAVVWQQVRTNGDLQRCSPDSIYTAVHRIAALGLDPSAPNDCFLVPFKTEATLIIGYGGLRKMALQDPSVLDIYAEKVCELDTYESGGPTSLPLHKYPGAFKPRGRAIGYYGAILYQAGHVRVLEQSVADIKAHRDKYSRAKDSQFWKETTYTKDGVVQTKGGFDEMALKTIIRMLCNPKYVTLRPVAWKALHAEVAEPEPPVRLIAAEQKTSAEHMADIFPERPTPQMFAEPADRHQEALPLTDDLPDDGWRIRVREGLTLLPAEHPYRAECMKALADAQVSPGHGDHIAANLSAIIDGLQEGAL